VDTLVRVRIAFATFSGLPDGWSGDQPAARLLGADFRVWSDPAVAWDGYDRVIIRSTWDYAGQGERFGEWCEAVGADRLRNVPEIVAWNADKRYLLDLDVPTVPTVLVGPGDRRPPLAGEVVVKPNVSAGARDTGRFGDAHHDDADRLIERIHATGRVALVQPYLDGVERDGETALVFIGGELSHVLRKQPILRTIGEAPLAGGEWRCVAVYLEDDFIALGAATDAQRDLAFAVYREVANRFAPPLYARIDLVPNLDGSPVLLELELIEPNLYLDLAPGAAERLAAAILRS
jgi:hypothetical protein